MFISSHKINNWSIKAFKNLNVSLKDSKIISESLVKTSLWGIDSHGIARIPHYLTKLKNGTINPNPQLKINKTANGTAQINGDNGHGIIIMNLATKTAINLAKKNGTSTVGVFNSSHCGAIGLYTRQITEAGLIGIAFTHTDSLVAPFNGKKPFFGTNPISIAVPTLNKKEPICLDMATSIVPWNKIINARKTNTAIDFGLGLDKNGNPTTDPHNIVCLNPIATYKGFALAFMIDLLCGPLNKMNYGPNLTSMYKDINKKRKLGSLVIAIDPAKFGGKKYIQNQASNIIKHLKLFGKDIRYPGQPEYIEFKKRIKNGIPLNKELLIEFNEWTKILKITKLI